jgi:hypothetical protein
MRSERRDEHRHVTLVGTDAAAAAALPRETPEAASFSLLRLSVPGRLLIVAVASALLWAAVLWALS